MKILEFQAKELFKKYGVPVPDGGAAVKADEAIYSGGITRRFPGTRRLRAGWAERDDRR